MRPPMMKRALTEAETETAPSNPPLTDSKREGYAEKVKLARHLHDQGVNPLRWTEAHPAPGAAQRQFQETGRKTRDNQFEVGGKLYDWSPAVSATPEQAKAIADAYVATPHDPPAAHVVPVESLVDVDKVPLKHPLGTPHAPRIGASQPDATADEERIALYRHYAKSGIDPDKAHLGDPLPMREQEKLKAEIAKLLPGDKTEISGLPMFYQGFDDGWIYMPNSSTQESEAVQKIRAESARRAVVGDEDRIGANDNDAGAEDAIAQHYLARDKQTEIGNRDQGVASSIALPPDARDEETNYVEQLDKGERDNGPAINGTAPKNSATAELQSATRNMPAVIDVIEKLQAGIPLTPAEKKIEARISASLKKAGIEFDYTLSDPDQLRDVYAQAQEAIRNTQQGTDNGSSEIAMAMLTLQGTQALAGGNLDDIRILQAGSAMEKLSIALQRYLPAARKIAVPAATELNIETAKEGPIDYGAAFKEFRDLFTGESSPSLTEVGPQPIESADPTDSATTTRAPSNQLGTLTKPDIAAVEEIFTAKPSTFERSTPVGMSSSQKAEMLSSGQIEEIELFGLPIYLKDPRGSLQTQERIDKLKQMVRDKMIECGMEEELAWGGKIEDEITKRAKERFVPKGDKGVQGSRRADLSFRIRWLGKVYIIDINTVDILRSGLMTKSERIAAEGLRLNRLIRLSINEALPEGLNELDEYAGKIGTVPKGKDMTDEEWDQAAKDWVDSFLDCDEPLEADVYLDPESKHPWPGKE